MSHTGSLLILATGIYAWRPKSVHDLTPDDFSRILAEPGTVSFLLLGTGRTMLPPPPEIRSLLSTASLSLETMDTGAAVRTYNILLAEDRPPAAALIAVD
jgi:uncharacterized protein